MSVRDTSIEVYYRIEAEGLLSKLRFKVYDILFHHGPLTAMEVCAMSDGVKQVSISPRMSELVERGVVREVGEKICSVTGNNSILWDVTSHCPTTPEAKVTENQKLKSRIQKLEAENAKLKQLIELHWPGVCTEI